MSKTMPDLFTMTLHTDVGTFLGACLDEAHAEARSEFSSLSDVDSAIMLAIALVGHQHLTPNVSDLVIHFLGEVISNRFHPSLYVLKGVPIHD